jgi:hypothetical protein
VWLARPRDACLHLSSLCARCQQIMICIGTRWFDCTGCA